MFFFGKTGGRSFRGQKTFGDLKGPRCPARRVTPKLSKIFLLFSQKKQFFLALPLVFLPVSAPSLAQDNEAATQSALQTQMREQQSHLAAQQAAASKAAAAQKQQQDLANQRIALAAKLRALDAQVADATEQLRDLKQQRAEAEAARDKDAKALGPLLPLIERLALYPSETLLASPQSTPDSLRALMAARGLSRALGDQAAAWRDREQKAEAAEAAVRLQAGNLADARTAQAKTSADLDAQIAAARQTAQAASAEARQEQALAAQAGAKANNLRALVGALEKLKQAREQAALQARQQETRRQRDELAAKIAAQPRIKLGQNALLMPVSGKLVRAYGADTGAGPATGLSIQAPPRARVVAPCAGTVLYADRFSSLGLMVILDCGNNVNFVLAGLAKLNLSVGANLRAGEPVGTMPDWNENTTTRPVLYLELRKGGQPINPTPFLQQSG